MKIKGLDIKFVFVYAGLYGTEEYVSTEKLCKIAESIVEISGDRQIYVLIIGNWEFAIQIPEKAIKSFTLNKEEWGIKNTCMCDTFCLNCPAKDCFERQGSSQLPEFNVVKL